MYDKLIVSRKLGHLCGPAGVPLPYPGQYIVKPITNIFGMGRGAYVETFTSTSTDHLAPGLFWMEIFEGEHVSVDVVDGVTDVVYVGERDGPSRFTRWYKSDRPVVHHPIISNLARKYRVVNYEMVGGNIIEIHLRENPDWAKYRARELIPVWDGQDTSHPLFVEDQDGDRLGFIVLK